MITHEELADYLMELAWRHPNIRYVAYGQDFEIINRDDFETPSLIISPIPAQMFGGSRINWNFNIEYLDTMREEMDTMKRIVSDASHFFIGYISVLDLQHQVNLPVNIEPVLSQYGGGKIVGCQINIGIENIYNIEKYKSPFYGNE